MDTHLSALPECGTFFIVLFHPCAGFVRDRLARRTTAPHGVAEPRHKPRTARVTSSRCAAASPVIGNLLAEPEVNAIIRRSRKRRRSDSGLVTIKKELKKEKKKKNRKNEKIDPHQNLSQSVADSLEPPCGIPDRRTDSTLATYLYFVSLARVCGREICQISSPLAPPLPSSPLTPPTSSELVNLRRDRSLVDKPDHTGLARVRERLYLKGGTVRLPDKTTGEPPSPSSYTYIHVNIYK